MAALTQNLCPQAHGNRWLLLLGTAHSWILLHQSDHLPVHALRGIPTPVVVKMVPVGEVLMTNEVGDAGE